MMNRGPLIRAALWLLEFRADLRAAFRRTPRALPFELAWTSDIGRPPLPAGAPESWNLLTAGTCLEGEPYPVELVRADALRLMRSAR